MYKLLPLLFLFNVGFVYSQEVNITLEVEISVLTIGPGSSLNDAFGHNAFRIKNDQIDIVYDYGRFDFNAPNFYLNFAKGKLNYFMGESSFQDFKGFYVWQNRTIEEQKLNLTDDQKKKLSQFLTTNIKPENKFYLYDFFYDNCATKIRDVLQESIDGKIEFNKPPDFEAKTFRTLIQQNLDWNSWGSFGIDVALGSVIDKKAEPVEYMFLPEYIHTFFANAKLTNGSEKNLVKNNTTIFKKVEQPKSSNFFISPLFILGLIGLLIIYLTFRDYKRKTRSKWLDAVLFIVTGTIGVLLLILWFATDHEATAQNYNLLWAFAINLFVVGQVLKYKPKAWFIKYITFLVIMLSLLTLHWILGVQRFAFALIPILVALCLRYVYLISYYKKQAVT